MRQAHHAPEHPGRGVVLIDARQLHLLQGIHLSLSRARAHSLSFSLCMCVCVCVCVCVRACVAFKSGVCWIDARQLYLLQGLGFRVQGLGFK